MVNLDSSVLVVVDMQNGFINDNSRHVIAPVVELVEQWKDAGRPVVFTRFLNSAGSQYERLIGWSRVTGSPETDIVDGLLPHADVIIEKDFYSYFNEAGVKLAEQNDWDTFVFCGIATDSCVLKSAVDAFELGHTPLVVANASASHAGEEVHKIGLHLIGRFIGSDQLISLDSLFLAM